MRYDATPIATYREVRFDGRRVVELFQDKVHVRGSSVLGADFDTTIALAQIQPRVSMLRVRNRAWVSGLWIASIGLVGAIVLVVQFGFQFWSAAPALLGCLGISGLVLCLATVRKVEFARFESHAAVPLLYVARSGPDQGAFDDFIELVLRQVRGGAGRGA